MFSMSLAKGKVHIIRICTFGALSSDLKIVKIG